MILRAGLSPEVRWTPGAFCLWVDAYSALLRYGAIGRAVLGEDFDAGVGDRLVSFALPPFAAGLNLSKDLLDGLRSGSISGRKTNRAPTSWASSMSGSGSTLLRNRPQHQALFQDSLSPAAANQGPILVGTVRNLVCGAIVTPMEGAYGNQERHPGRFAGGA